MSASCYIAAFDITDDRERSRAAKVLEGYGERVQKSVFECVLTRSGLRRLEEALKELELETGGVTVYRVGPRFHRIRIGKAPEGAEAADDHAYMV